MQLQIPHSYTLKPTRENFDGGKLSAEYLRMRCDYFSKFISAYRNIVQIRQNLITFLVMFNATRR